MIPGSTRCHLSLGSFTTYIEKILAFFDHLHPCVDIFYAMNVDKKWTFFDHLPTSSWKRSLWTTPIRCRIWILKCIWWFNSLTQLLRPVWPHTKFKNVMKSPRLQKAIYTFVMQMGSFCFWTSISMHFWFQNVINSLKNVYNDFRLTLTPLWNDCCSLGNFQWSCHL